MSEPGQQEITSKSQANKTSSQKIGRREVLWSLGKLIGENALVTGAATAVGILHGEWLGRKNANKIEDTQVEHLKHNKSDQVRQALEQGTGIQERKTYTRVLNEILASPLFTPERTLLENNYVQNAESLDEIDKGFWVLSDVDARARLLQKRFNLRQSGAYADRLLPLSQNYIDWVTKQGIYPEVMGVCLDAYPKARRAIEKLKYVLQKDIDDKTKPDDLMINLGGMARLIKEETSNFNTIGTGRAIDEINTDRDAYPTGIESLKKLCDALKVDTGLDFDWKNIPGSVRGDKTVNISGGAIGLQFMPPVALELYELMDTIGMRFNPFDLESSVIGGWIFLAKELRDKNKIIRWGFRQNDSDAEYYGIHKWNPHPEEIQSIRDAHTSFFRNFLPQAGRTR